MPRSLTQKQHLTDTKPALWTRAADISCAGGFSPHIETDATALLALRPTWYYGMRFTKKISLV
jgi:hypothetical protein